MHRPENLSREQERQCERSENISMALGHLRKSVECGDRLRIETACFGLAGRIYGSPDINVDDAEEIGRTLLFIKNRLKFGLHERLRKFLSPLVTAVEAQIEEAEKEVAR